MWSQILNLCLGLWLMAAPELLGYKGAATDNGHIIGPIIATFAIISLWEATHGVRKWNYPLGIWLLVAPWILHYSDTISIGSDMATGILVIILSSIAGKRTYNFGGGWSSLWRKDPDHANR